MIGFESSNQFHVVNRSLNHPFEEAILTLLETCGSKDEVCVFIGGVTLPKSLVLTVKLTVKAVAVTSRDRRRVTPPYP